MLFMVGEISGGLLEPIGYVLMTIHNGISTVDICKIEYSPIRPWNPLYRFDAIVGKETECHGCSPGSELSIPNKVKEKIKVQNPMSDYLNVFFKDSEFLSGSRTFTLLDIYGKLVFSERLVVAEPQVVIPIGNTLQGAYLLQVESKDDIHTMLITIK